MHRAPSQTGFTLMELLVVIAIAAVLTGLAVPSFRAAMQSAEARSAATDFYSALNRARSEGIARNNAVSVCVRDALQPSPPRCAAVGSTVWQNGWMVYADAAPDTPLQVSDPLPNGFTLGAVASPVRFDAFGRAASAATFNLCNSASAAVGRRITVSRSGRVALEARPC